MTSSSMNTPAFLAFCFFLTSTIAPAQSTTEPIVSPTLTHATVFMTRAELTATAKVTVSGGEQQVTIQNIPLSIDPASIQVKGTGEAVITGVKFVRNYLQNSPRPAPILALDDTLRTVQDEIDAAELTRSVLEEEKALILANKQVSGAATGVKVADLKEMANFYRERLNDIGTKVLRLDTRLKILKERARNIGNQLADWQNRRNQPTGGIQIRTSAAARTTLNLEISYVVNGAGWRPLYDVRAEDTNAPIALIYKAEVFQSTGQNWDNIRLTLSTSNPSLGGTQPDLRTQYVDFPPPVVVREETAHLSKQTLSAGFGIPSQATNAPEADVQSTADYTQVLENDLSVTFEIALPYSIPSGAQPQLVDIARHTIPATYRHFSIPKLDPDAFLVAQLSGWEKYNLLSGQANVYFQGTYVGQTRLNTHRTTDTLSVSLGRDKKVIVERERLNQYSSKRFIGSNVREIVSYRLLVRNTKSDVLHLTLEDQVPVSRNSDIEVSLEETTGAKFSPETGQLTWEMDLKPGESRTFDIRFELKYPKGKTVRF